MRILKFIGILLLITIAVGFIISLIMPTRQRIERTISINAPASEVYQHLKLFKNFSDWAVWNNRDSTVKMTIEGKDGAPGTSLGWDGDPEISGHGHIELVSLQELKKIVHQIVFESPSKGTAKSVFKLNEANGVTTLHWQFDMATPRPKNIFNLFSNMNKTMGPDFEEGLRSVKAAIEKTPRAKEKEISYVVKQLNFPGTSFAFVRQKIKMTDIGSFFSAHLPAIYSDLAMNKILPGMAAGLIYSWDELTQETDLAAAVAIPAQTTLPGPMVQVTEIPASKAIYVDYFGAYTASKKAYESLENYLAENKLKQKLPVIEYYMNDPATVDTSKWHTRIIMLVD